MNYEKGIQELLEAYKQLKIKYKNNLYLFLVGDDEINLKQKIKQKFKNLSIKLFSNSKNIYDFYIASDIYCLPSYREGFSNSVLEAASMELPIIGTNINGIIDIIKNKKNGLLVNVKSKLDLENCLLKLILDKKLRIKYGKNARKDIITKFKKKILIKSFMNYYKKNFYIN